MSLTEILSSISLISNYYRTAMVYLRSLTEILSSPLSYALYLLEFLRNIALPCHYLPDEANRDSIFPSILHTTYISLNFLLLPHWHGLPDEVNNIFLNFWLILHCHGLPGLISLTDILSSLYLKHCISLNFYLLSRFHAWSTWWG